MLPDCVARCDWLHELNSSFWPEERDSESFRCCIDWLTEVLMLTYIVNLYVNLYLEVLAIEYEAIL